LRWELGKWEIQLGREPRWDRMAKGERGDKKLEVIGSIGILRTCGLILKLLGSFAMMKRVIFLKDNSDYHGKIVFRQEWKLSRKQVQ
jgi:hypothetical protein